MTDCNCNQDVISVHEIIDNVIQTNLKKGDKE